MIFFNSRTKENKFWDWFTKKSNIYFKFEEDRENLFDELKSKLNKINQDLTFEFGPVRDNKREFVISADGIKGSFPDVIKVVNAAPNLPNFKIIAFRQPHLDFTKINYKDIQLDFKDVFFRYGKNNGKLDIELNIRDYQDNIDWATAAFLLLDNILGEYDTEMFINGIDRKQLIEYELNSLLPISDLSKILLDYKLEFQN